MSQFCVVGFSNNDTHLEGFHLSSFCVSMWVFVWPLHIFKINSTTIFSGFVFTKCLCADPHISSSSRGNSCCVRVAASAPSDQLVCPHAKSARHWHPALLHTDSTCLTRTALRLTWPRVSSVLRRQTHRVHINLPASGRMGKSQPSQPEPYVVNH